MYLSSPTSLPVPLGTRHPVYGVQFHPESAASHQGQLLLHNFLSLVATPLEN